MRLRLAAAASLAALIFSACANPLADVVQRDVQQSQTTVTQTPPVVDSFTLSSVTTYDGTVGFTIASTHPGTAATSITHWLVNESASAPSASDAAWAAVSAAVSGTYTVSSSYTLTGLGTYGDRTLYAWLKNDLGLVSAPATAATSVVKYAQYGGPVVDSFALSGSSTTYDGAVGFTLASTHPGDGAGTIAGYVINESATAPSASASGWLAFSSPVASSYTLSNPGVFGARTLYAWLKNEKGIVSASATVSVTYSDYGKPAFTLTLNSATPTDDPTAHFTISGTNPGAGAGSITGWAVSESSSPPSLALITGTQPGDFTVSLTAGTHTFYVWAKNDHDKVNDQIYQAITINTRSAVIPSYTFISGQEQLTITFDVAMSSPSVALTGTMGSQIVEWTDSTHLKIKSSNSSGLWPQSGGTIIVNGNTSYGIPISQASQSCAVVYCVCVSPAGSSGAEGGPRAPLDTIQAGINKAKTLYIDTSSGPAEVRVAAGTYTSAYSTTGTPVALMVEGVSVYGSYGSSFTTRSLNPPTSTMEDTSASDNAANDPYRTVDAGSTLTSATVIDGFIINSASIPLTLRNVTTIYCSGSPTISSNSITGRDCGFVSYGVYLTGSAAPVIENNTIQTGQGTNSKGVYAAGGTSVTPQILYNTITAGRSIMLRSAAIELDNSSANALIVGNTLSGGPTGAASSYGIYNKASPKIYNNVILGGSNSTDTWGIYTSSGSPIIRNNTINLGSGGGSTDAAIIINSGSPAIDNNILYKSSNGTTGYGVYQSSASGPSSLKNNDFYNFGITALYYTSVTALTLIGDVNGLSGALDNVVQGPSFTTTPDVYHLESSSAVKALGLNGNAQSPAWDFSTDKDKVQRTPSDSTTTTGWSLGAFEKN